MKDYKKIIGQYEEVVKHQWGQNKEALFNKIVDLFNNRDLSRIAVLTYKKYGVKGIAKFFTEQGLSCDMAGKGPGGLRLIVVEKNKELSRIKIDKMITFELNDKKYSVNTGGAIFSRSGLDKGTEFLLKTVLQEKIDLNPQRVGDFGVGWGAIPLALSTEFPAAEFVVYEKDESSLEVAKENLKNFKNIEYHQVDFVKDRLEENNLDYVICNPPFHINKEEIDMLFKNIGSVLEGDGKVYFVIEKTYLKNFEEAANKHLEYVNRFERKDFSVFLYKKV